MRHQGKVNAKTLSMEILNELREKGMAQRGLLRYVVRGKDIIVKRI